MDIFYVLAIEVSNNDINISKGSNYHGPFSLIEIQIDVYLTREHTVNKVEHIQSTMEEITENFQAGKYW